MGPHHTRPRRFVARTALTAAGTALAALLATAGIVSAANSGSNAPSAEVIPRTGLKYSQTVEVKGHHLPKGSGTVAATICGLTTAQGQKIKSPTADDCAGAESVGKLVQVKSWQSDGEFDTKYTLPTSGQQFGKNKRFCDKTHYCAIVVADANPDKPAYDVPVDILFNDQKAPPSSTPTTKPKTTTTKPGSGQPGSTTTTTEGDTTTTTAGSSGGGGGSGSGTVDVSGDPNNPHVHVGINVNVDPPPSAGPGAPPIAPPPVAPPPLPPQAVDALNQVCTQLAGAVTQAGGDPSALLTACSSIANGTGPEQLSTVLQAPSLLCIAGASAWQNNQQITDACNQAAAGAQPVTSQVGNALSSLLP